MPVLEAEAKKNLSSLEAWVRRNLAEHATQQGGNEIVESFSFDDECENPDKVPLDITEDDYDPFTSKKPTKNGDGTQPGFVPNIRPGPPGPKPACVGKCGNLLQSVVFTVPSNWLNG